MQSETVKLLTITHLPVFRATTPWPVKWNQKNLPVPFTVL